MYMLVYVYFDNVDYVDYVHVLHPTGHPIYLIHPVFLFGIVYLNCRSLADRGKLITQLHYFGFITIHMCSQVSNCCIESCLHLIH